MGEVYNVKYYTMDLIPKHRDDYITLRLKWFVELMGLKRTDWPVNCTELLKKAAALSHMHFEYGFADMPDKYDAITEYIAEHDLYIMLFNRGKVNFPFQSSSDRRLSFTIAHELSHIALGHLLIPRAAKTKEERAMEEIEADEFAGRLLMPEKMLFSCNYYSIDSAAAYFNVSKTALWKRLNNIKRLDLLHSKRVHSCSTCGNTKFSIFAKFCRICGAPLSRDKKGIQRINYPETFQMDQYKRVLQCPLCNSKQISGDKCCICGTYIFNYCSDLLSGNGNCTYSNPGNSRYCEMCGKETYFYKRGLLDPWNEELEQLQTGASGCCKTIKDE